MFIKCTEYAVKFRANHFRFVADRSSLYEISSETKYSSAVVVVVVVVVTPSHYPCHPPCTTSRVLVGGATAQGL